jgi:hypothetical protein
VGGYNNRDGLSVQDCSALVLIRTDFDQEFSPVPPRTSLLALRSTIHAFECVIRGPSGTTNWCGPFCGPNPTSGGNAVVLKDSFLFGSGCAIEGGTGSGAWCGGVPAHCFPGGDGGVGLDIDASSEAHIVGTTLAAGPGGAPCTFGTASCVGGLPGVALVQQGSFENLGGVARTYELSPAHPTGTSGTLRATGVAGELVLSLIGSAPSATYVPLHIGTQLVRPPYLIVSEGAIPADGVLSKNVTLPPVPPPLAFATTYRQGFFFQAGGNALLSSATAVVTLAQ